MRIVGVSGEQGGRRGLRRSLFEILLIAAALGGAAGAHAAEESMGLAQALELLDAQSLTLVQARARADEARAVVRQARAALLPSVSAAGGYLRNSDEAKLAVGSIFDSIEATLGRISPVPIQLDRSKLPADTVIQPLDQFTVSGAVRVPLFVGSAWADLSAARHAADAAEESLKATRLTLRGALSQATWMASAAEEIVRASERGVDIARAHWESARRALAAGTGSRLAVLQAETEVTRRESDLVRARADRERAELAIGVLLGRAEPVRVFVTELAEPGGLTTEALTAEALERRPELKAQAAQVEVGEAQLSSARWRLAPQLSATFSAFAASVAFPTGEKSGWRASLDLAWPLYDGGLRYGKARQAEAASSSARAALAAQRVEILREVQDAARDVGVARERLRLAERQKALASEAAASASRGFEAGIAGSIEVLDANDRLYQSDVGLADARARLGVAKVALERARGRL